MFWGYYTPLFETSVSPWTTLGPLALVVSVSLLQEAYTDVKRHRSDNMTNYHPCVVLRRADTSDHEAKRGRKKTAKRDPRLNDGHDLKVSVAGNEVHIAFESVFRKNIRAGDLVIVRNREMIPADLILLASANEGGNAYIETSSIDGETNLKLRNSPRIPLNHERRASAFSSSSLYAGRSLDENEQTDSQSHGSESIEQAVQRVVNMSLLGHPDGVSALANPANADEGPILERNVSSNRKGLRLLIGNFAQVEATRSVPKVGENVTYIASLTSEPPNTHVNNYSGKLSLPPDSAGARSFHAPLNVENILLRGAVLRNTEWVVGLACFTGADTKLVMNSVATPSKFSQMDVLINRTVFLVLFIMIVCVCSLGAIAVYENKKSFHQLWYAGYSKDPSEPWPYFNLVESSGIGNPQWKTTTQNFIQNTVMFITLLSNFVPLALYVSVEITTIMMMMYIGWDLHMYHKESDTPAVARSSIVTDLGLVEYIFSDKTGTLTSNIMEFKRCSVDGHVFGMPLAKAAPQLDSNLKHPSNDESKISYMVHPLKHLLADSGSASFLSSIPDAFAGLEDKLSFNAEMFLRVMSICHTVVVEKDHVVPLSEQVDDSKLMGGKQRARLDTGDSHDRSGISGKAKKNKKKKKDEDGAPAGCAYQAESPDEGALVSAASKQYGFQLVGRNSSGVQISCPCPSLLEDKDIVKGLKDGSMSAKILAPKTASPAGASSKYSRTQVNSVDNGVTPRIETWPILAINKFDSDRKRMSVLVRSPPELGSVPMLLCKGADSSMLIDEVCGGTRMLDSIVDKNDRGPKVKPESEADNSELDSLLGLQAHLGGKLVL
jgi:magnesium-transporting ATPase (P-type)